MKLVLQELTSLNYLRDCLKSPILMTPISQHLAECLQLSTLCLGLQSTRLDIDSALGRCSIGLNHLREFLQPQSHIMSQSSISSSTTQVGSPNHFLSLRERERERERESLQLLRQRSVVWKYFLCFLKISQFP